MLEQMPRRHVSPGHPGSSTHQPVLFRYLYDATMIVTLYSMLMCLQICFYRPFLVK